MKRRMRSLWWMMVIALVGFAACESPEEDVVPTIEVNPTALTFEFEGGSQSVTLRASHSWSVEVTLGGDWLGVELLSGGPTEGLSLAVTAWENSSDQERRGEIRFTSEDVSATLAVVQECEQIEALPEATKANSYIVNGKEYALPSVAFVMMGENPAMVASTSPRLSNADAILNSGTYFYGAVGPLLKGVKFDIVTQSQPFTFISTLSNFALSAVAPTMTEEIVRGECLFDVEGNVATLKVSFELTDGTLGAFYLSAEANSVDINDNSICRGDETKPIRASFYLEEGDMTYLYFTPGGIDYFEELEVATWYMYICVENELLSGNSMFLSELAGYEFVMGHADNFDSSQSWQITGDDLGGASGKLALATSGEGQYKVSFDVEYEGVSYKALFDGKCRSCEDAPVVETNYIEADGVKYDLVEASVDCTNQVWEVVVVTSSGESARITMPAEMFDGNPRGFSQSDQLTVSWGDKTFSKANGYSGTLTCSLNSATGELSVEFTNYSGFNLKYDGLATVVQ